MTCLIGSDSRFSAHLGLPFRGSLSIYFLSRHLASHVWGYCGVRLHPWCGAMPGSWRMRRFSKRCTAIGREQAHVSVGLRWKDVPYQDSCVGRWEGDACRRLGMYDKIR